MAAALWWTLAAATWLGIGQMVEHTSVVWIMVATKLRPLEYLRGCWTAVQPQNGRWPQPTDRWNTSEVVEPQYNPKMAAANWWPQPKHPKSAAAGTETSPVDLLQAKQQNDYWNDIEFLEKQEAKDRKRRQAHRFNLKERRWEAFERVSMLENDTLDYRPIHAGKRKTLSNQVLHVAQQCENSVANTLSSTLPRTPTDWTKQQSDDEQANKTSGQDPQPAALEEPDVKKHKGMRTNDNTAQQLLHLAPWMIQTFQTDQPTDLGRAHPSIERKDAKFRWAPYSRVPPRLNNMVKHSWQQVAAPPYGIQLIEHFQKWKAQNSSSK